MINLISLPHSIDMYFSYKLHQETTRKRILVSLIVLVCYSSFMTITYHFAMLPQTYEMTIASLKTNKEKLVNLSNSHFHDYSKFEHFQTLHVHKLTTKNFSWKECYKSIWTMGKDFTDAWLMNGAIQSTYFSM